MVGGRREGEKEGEREGKREGGRRGKGGREGRSEAKEGVGGSFKLKLALRECACLGCGRSFQEGTAYQRSRVDRSNKGEEEEKGLATFVRTVCLDAKTKRQINVSDDRE